MPDGPDYTALTRGQLALLRRIDTGETGLAALHHLVRLALDVLGGSGAGFAECGAEDGRIVAAAGVCEHALGRRVGHDRLTADAATFLPVEPAEDSTGTDHLLITRCEVGDVLVGFLYVAYTELDTDPGPEYHAVLDLLAAHAAHLYGDRAGLPVHGDSPEAAGAWLTATGVPQLPATPERTHEDRDLFVAVTSHELRTPVTVIKGYADTLTNHWESLGEEGRREAVRVVGARAGELARLVDRLLSATSDDGGIGGSPPGPFDLVDALRAAMGELPEDLRRRLVADLPAELPKAFGDRESLATILTELATNADKYSPDGTEVTVTAAADDTTVTFRVADRGIGVRPEHVERAFERYWQGEPDDDGRNPGAGLGLYLVRRIVERQRGWVSLRPRAGGGTVAEVSLPRA
ncbi:HAMP domain-containing sensor histidine kinase [Actinoplanes sp. NPDC049316]|uniref:sensor histidine kinase n=1 Tax=Actinoplanes sp. NPDC049316 TaxID=3154727 RepID=UPI00341E2624